MFANIMPLALIRHEALIKRMAFMPLALIRRMALIRHGTLMPMTLIIALLIGLFITLNPQASGAREQIKIIGSSTLFPFSALVAERFGRTTTYPTPIVESTGTGGGFKLFCAGIGTNYPDISNASRRIKKSEYDRCSAAGIRMIEVQIGFDGIVIASSAQGVAFQLTPRIIFQALAARVPIKGVFYKNPYKRWSDIDPSLPKVKIAVFGPPPTSGTRDAFVEIAMEEGAKTFPIIAEIKKESEKKFKAIAHSLREDGAFIEAGENDNLVIQKLVANKNAMGIIGFSFLENNRDRLQAATVNNVSADFENIAKGDYPISRSLFFYVKKNHIGIVPGLRGYIKEFTRKQTWGDGGYLSDKGLIPLSKSERQRVKSQARGLKTFKF